MDLRRYIQRHQLPGYLKVFSRIAGKPMGCIGDISKDDLLLISQLSTLVGVRLELRLKASELGGHP